MTTDPPVGPFPIGSTVTLQCSVNPPPPEGVTYSWSTSIPSTDFNVNQPNLTITIPTKHPSKGHYYCTVSNGSIELGVGSATIDVKGEGGSFFIAVKVCTGHNSTNRMHTHNHYLTMQTTTTVQGKCTRVYA